MAINKKVYIKITSFVLYTWKLNRRLLTNGKLNTLSGELNTVKKGITEPIVKTSKKAFMMVKPSVK